MHSDIGAMERMEIIRDLRLAKFDVLVGINLLREGLDLPEVSAWSQSWTPIRRASCARKRVSSRPLDARRETREGRVHASTRITITPAMRAAMDETARRRQIQDAYNKAHGIVPKTIVKVRPRPHRNLRLRPHRRHKGTGGVKMTRQELAT